MTARIATREATVRFGAATALDAVDLHVPAGAVIVVLGPSGSGKSTLLRAVAGLQPLDAGRILIDGVDVAAVPPHRRGVGLMFQDHALFPHLDVGANVAFGLRMQGWAPARARARVAELLGLVGLPGTERRPVQTLSGGEQQRVALARSVAPSPRALLLDEPLGALDRPLRERLVAELRQIVREIGLTVVAVTHDQAEAFALADGLVVLDEGRVLQHGTPAEVWERPSSARVARLLGFTNVVPVAVEGGRVQSPWGDLGVAPGPVVAAVVRPEGVRLDPAGPIEGVIRSTTFAGARHRIIVAVDGAPDLAAEVTGPAPATGSRVRLAIDPAAVSPLER